MPDATIALEGEQVEIIDHRIAFQALSNISSNIAFWKVLTEYRVQIAIIVRLFSDWHIQRTRDALSILVLKSIFGGLRQGSSIFSK